MRWKQNWLVEKDYYLQQIRELEFSLEKRGRWFFAGYSCYSARLILDQMKKESDEDYIAEDEGTDVMI